MAEPVVLAFDTATPATVVGLAGGALADPLELRDDPGPEQRPRHAQQLLPLARAALAHAGLGFGDVGRIAVGLGPGSFTGLRIGLATARALSLGSGAELAGVSTLEALALPAAREQPAGATVAAVLDARRGEVFLAAWRDGVRVVAAQALAPERAADVAAAGWTAVGDGAVRYRSVLEAAGVAIPGDGSPLHRLGAPALLALGARAAAVLRTDALPDYLRLPDAEVSLRARTSS
ncbi:tRNA (adenosine(37)-N6)-threonylcarbamoyltransferase complex dimerization subunit type 1 TsaB [Capillimicrobium parvum]|uniref:Gcp-like domain-containing protein n=1 Tax=Capillimicrobium parvum TaxID=2884022 RepID=A0A9E7C1I0_9ACTN|nr:tRNA (adenosine(37)-N6)-threonylcarbamoyltransferase complex dimerization subunit type 1 TsaB [Capillimicrobium parvum]UGS37411.1 hypothetical protein DSM104329_03827 [Capillimicrobium parvum]